ncbi:hypothetical protein [Devosia sp.]|uniref:hypothetical protein n=1 Tax=Devosia sp. TaxID=1871048 RepID=UPI003BAC81FA
MTTLSDTPAAVAASKPAIVAVRTRLAFLVFFAVYPLVTALLYVLFPLTAGWETWQRTLVLVPIMVVSLVFFVIPAIQGRFGRFIATGRW